MCVREHVDLLPVPGGFDSPKKRCSSTDVLTNGGLAYDFSTVQ